MQLELLHGCRCYEQNCFDGVDDATETVIENDVDGDLDLLRSDSTSSLAALSEFAPTKDDLPAVDRCALALLRPNQAAIPTPCALQHELVWERTKQFEP